MTTIVIGAGVIGLAIARELQRRGREVLVVDRDSPGLGASFGNMASIAVTEFMPASRPAIWKKIPGWMLDPEGPVRVRPAYMPRLIPWFLRFVAASRPTRLRRLEEQGAILCQRALDDTVELMRDLGMEEDLSREGCISLYLDKNEFADDRDHIELLERFGFRHVVLSGEEARHLEPELSRDIGMAVLFPDNRTVRDPYQLVLRIAERFTAAGGRIERGEVAGFGHGGQVRQVRLKDGRMLAADEVVIAAGAFTGRLARLLGESMPLETERGYHTQILSPGITLRHSLIWPARAFMVSPTAGGLRVGGTVEMAGLDAAPDFRRSKVTVRRAQTALPNLQCKDFREWMGHRPAFPDTVPVMSPSMRVKGVYYATGHGHLGLTYAATTARLMADLMTGRTPDIDMAPYRIDRF